MYRYRMVGWLTKQTGELGTNLVEGVILRSYVLEYDIDYRAEQWRNTLIHTLNADQFTEHG